MKIRGCISACLAVTAVLNSIVALKADRLEHLKKYEGRYQIVEGDPRRCLAQVDVVHSRDENYLALNRPIDVRRLRRDYSWMRFTHLNEGQQLREAFFLISKYVKSVAKETQDGWKVAQLQKDCRIRFLCGRWQKTHWVLLTDQALEIGSPSEKQQCVYKRAPIKLPYKVQGVHNWLEPLVYLCSTT